MNKLFQKVIHCHIVDKLPQLYYAGAVYTSSLIGVSNLFCSVAFAPSYRFSPCPFESVGCKFMFLSGWSIVKAISYGFIWPAFWPYAIGKMILCNPVYNDMQNTNIYCDRNGKSMRGINKNGIMPHLIPDFNYQTPIKY